MDKAGIAYLVSLLRGKALAWAPALWDDQSPLLASYAAFTGEIRKVFNHQVQVKTPQRELSLCQGSSSVAAYAVDFRILAAESGWNEESLQAGFANGFSDIKDELVWTF